MVQEDICCKDVLVQLSAIENSVKSLSNHILEKNKLEKLEVKEFGSVTGLEIIGKVNNQRLILGNLKILKEYNVENVRHQDEEELTKKGNRNN